MMRIVILAAVALVAMLAETAAIVPRGGGRAGGGGGGKVGGGAAHAPNFQPPANRPAPKAAPQPKVNRPAHVPSPQPKVQPQPKAQPKVQPRPQPLPGGQPKNRPSVIGKQGGGGSIGGGGAGKGGVNKPTTLPGQTKPKPKIDPGFGVQPKGPGVNRPGIDNRPGKKDPGAINRPNGKSGPIDRPGVGGITRPKDTRPLDRPNVVNKPNINNPNINRPKVNVNQPKTNINQGGIGNKGPTTIVNRPTTNTNISSNVTNVTNVNRPVNVSNVAVRSNNYRPYGGYHAGWYHGGWGAWPAVPSFWAGVAVGSLAYRPTFVYANPYYVLPPPTTIIQSSIYVVQPALDYSQPIAVPTAREAELQDESVAKASLSSFDLAKAAFKKGYYETALKETDRAIKTMPGDTTMHELRALTLFATKKYKDAAGVLYAVLAKGPGWNWDTMSALYPDGDVYTKQLRDLEQFVKDNPKASEGHFVLGYHYLVLDEQEAAAAELSEAARLNPKDNVSAELARALMTRPNQPASKE